jgi:hypothetical protein
MRLFDRGFGSRRGGGAVGKRRDPFSAIGLRTVVVGTVVRVSSIVSHDS